MPNTHHPSRFDVHLSFNVDEHVVVFDWFQFWGYASIQVDGTEVLEEHHNLGTALVRTYETQVGPHEVIIEKHRKAIFAGLRKQVFRVLIDGVRQDIPGTM